VEDLSISFFLLLKNYEGVFTMSTDLLQQLLEVDQKAREQERIHLIQNFFNLGVSIKIIAEATSVSVEDVKRIVNS
jgi:hypothetical protein